MTRHHLGTSFCHGEDSCYHVGPLRTESFLMGDVFMSDAPQAKPDDGIKDPPNTVGGILRQLGPGLIIAGSIVGSGELIATTAVGAEAGFALMWLIIIGCVIKVFTQIEFGRYTIVNGRTTMDGLNEVPGPRVHVNWIVWYWLIMFSASLAQLGGIVGSVGQALTITKPLTSAGALSNRYQDLQIKLTVNQALLQQNTGGDEEKIAELNQERTALTAELEEIERPYLATEAYRQVKAELDATRQQLATLDSETSVEAKQLALRQQELEADEKKLRGPPSSHDEVIWAAIITSITIVVLVVGHYNLIQNFATVLVAGFTFITIGNLVHLQSLPDWRVNWEDLVAGMSFNMPPSGLATALMAFGIIGVGATELIQYPYWCLEKGYARWTGPRDDSAQWAARAAGWLRVMRWDAWASMLVYTFATIAFYLLGAAVLGRTGLNPAGSQMVRTLAEMYVPVFGEAAHMIFLFGAFAVLYSTFFVANASHARVCADAVRVFGLSSGGEKANRFWTVVFCALFPLICLTVYGYVRAPKQLVLLSGLMQAIMLPMLGAAALYFRYRRCDDRVRPGKLWDICLWISGAGLLLAGGWAFFDKISAALLRAG